MSKITEYSASTTTKEAQYFIVAIDSDSDGVYETQKQALNILRASLYGTSSLIFKLSKGADIASANALVLGVDGNSFDITGTTAITSIGTIQIGTVVVLQFDGILTLTHHATNLILPGAVNIATAIGDVAAFHEYDTGKWRCLYYTKASGETISVSSVEGSAVLSTGELIGKVIVSDGADGVAWGYNLSAIITVTSAAVLLDISHGVVLGDGSSNAIVITLPAAADVDGREYTVKKIDSTANTVTLDGDGTETIDGALTQIISAQYDAIKIKSDGSNWYII